MSHDSHSGHHIVPVQVLTYTFLGLLFLTILTWVTATQMQLGALSIPVALLIAFTKVSLVINYFMAVKYDKPIIKIIAYGMGMFVLFFMGFTLLDTNTRGIYNHEPLNEYDRKAADSLNNVGNRITKSEGGVLMVTPTDSLMATKAALTADSTAAAKIK